MKNGSKSKLIISVALILTMVMMSGCATFDSFRNTFIAGTTDSSSENVITIGVFEPQTGRYSETGISELKGIELANSIYNSVNGYQVKLVSVDTQSSTNAAESAVQGLIEMKPVAIIGSCEEATSLIASKYIDKAGIPTITPAATNPLITQNHSYYFRASVTGSQMGSGIADYAYGHLGSTHIGIITAANDTAATALLDGFDDRIKELLKTEKEDAEEDNVDDEDKDGDKDEDKNPVVLKTESSFEDADIAKLIKSIKKERVDTLIIPLGTETMDAFFKAAEKAGLTNITYIGTKAWGNQDFVDMMKNHNSIKVAFPYPSVLGSNDKMTKETERFSIEYANKYGSSDIPTENATLGYDSYLLLINAIHNADSIEGADIKKALLELKNVKCATGSFTFDKKGNTLRSVKISTIKDGMVESIYVTKDTAYAEELEGLDK